MKIKLYKKAPKCPKCKVPMKPEGMTHTDEQQKKIDCEHKWKSKGISREKGSSCGTRKEKCPKCGETRSFLLKYTYGGGTEECPVEEELTFSYIPSAELYRCPKCLDLYKVEEQDA